MSLRVHSRLHWAATALLVSLAPGAQAGGADDVTPSKGVGLTLPAASARSTPSRAAIPIFTRPDVTSRLPVLENDWPSARILSTTSFERPAAESAEGAAEPRFTGATSTAPSAAGSARSVPLGAGRATFYQYNGRTASGERFEPDGHTAARATLPLGTRVRVVNRGNGRSVVVRINDRTGPSTRANRKIVIDLSRGSARAIGIQGVGTVALYSAE